MRQFKRIVLLLLVLAIIFSLNGFSKNDKVKTTLNSTEQCGWFTVEGDSFGTSGKVEITGDVFRIAKFTTGIPETVTLNKAIYKYTTLSAAAVAIAGCALAAIAVVDKSEDAGIKVTLTKYKAAESNAPETITGTYYPSTNEFKLEKSLCM